MRLREAWWKNHLCKLGQVEEMIQKSFSLGVNGGLPAAVMQSIFATPVEEWFFLWDNAPVPFVAVFKKYCSLPTTASSTYNSHQSIRLYSGILLRILKVELDLGGGNSLQETCVGAIRTIAADEFTTAIKRLFEFCEKSIRSSKGCAEKKDYN